MPTFNDSEPKKFEILEPQDIRWQITEFEIGISRGAKTAGSDEYNITFMAEDTGVSWKEKIQDHPSTAWKIDLLLKSGGVKLAKGQSFEFREDLAHQKGLLWVNPIGLRGHGRVKVEAYAKTSDKPGHPTGRSNRMDIFYTDKGVLPRVEPPAAEPCPF